MLQLHETESSLPKINQASFLNNLTDLIFNKREISSTISNDKLSLFSKQSEIITSKKLQNSKSKIILKNSGNFCKLEENATNLKSKPPLPNQKSTHIGDFSVKFKQKQPQTSLVEESSNINNNNSNNTHATAQNNENYQETPLMSKSNSQNMNTRPKNSKANIYQEHLNEINYQNSLRSSQSPPVSKINSKLIESNQSYSVIDQLIKDTNAIIINKNNAKNNVNAQSKSSPNNTLKISNSNETSNPFSAMNQRSSAQLSPNTTTNTSNNNNIPVLVPLPIPTLPMQQNYAPYYTPQYTMQQPQSSSYVQENYSQMPLLVGLEPNMMLGTLTVAPIQKENSRDIFNTSNGDFKSANNSQTTEQGMSKIVQPKIFTKQQTNAKVIRMEQDNSPPRPKIKPDLKPSDSVSSLKGITSSSPSLNSSKKDTSIDANNSTISEAKSRSPLSYNEPGVFNRDINKNISEKIEKFSYVQNNFVNPESIIQSITSRNYIASAKIKEEIESIILKAESKKESIKKVEDSEQIRDQNVSGNKASYQSYPKNQLQFPTNEILAEMKDNFNHREPRFLTNQQQSNAPLTPIREKAARLIENSNSLSVQTQTGKLISSPRIQKDKPLQTSLPKQLENNLQSISNQRAASKEAIERNKKIDLEKIDQTKMNNNEPKVNTKADKKIDTKVYSNQNNKPPILDSVANLSPEFISEFKTSISVGSDFTYNDITVQLVDDLNSAKKLFIHCFRIVPIPERSVTLKSGQIVKVDLNFANGNKFIKKELKKEIIIPPNSDINTLESYLENGNLVIKCLLRNETHPSYMPKNFQPRLSKLPPAPLNKAIHKNSHPEQPKSNSSQSENDNFKANSSNNKKSLYSDFNDADVKHKYKSQTNQLADKLSQAAQNGLFENSIFNQAETKHSRRNQSQPKTFLNNENYSRDKPIGGDANNNNMERKRAHNSEMQSKPTYTNQNFLNVDAFANNLEQFEPYAKYPSQRRKNEETKVLRSRNSLHNIKKRRYKSNENLLDSCELETTNKDRRRGSSLANLIDKDRSRPPSVSSNYSLNHDSSGSKAVRFDRNCRKSTKSCERKYEFPDQHHHRRHHHNHFGLHYSQDEMENEYPSSSKPGKRASSNIGISSSNKSSSSKMINETLQDGYNCITKDGLDNIFLTYFFKLPSCSPSDRTQVRIENHNILKLKIIQETQFRSKLKKENSNYHHGCNHHISNGNSMNNLKLLSNSNSSLASLSPSIVSNSCESLEDSMSTCCQDDSSKIMLREFSRQCRLPRNLFEFDEKGVTVSFVNSVWVRVEIPIMDFLQPIYDFKTENKSTNKKKQNLEKQSSSSYNHEIIDNSNINSNTKKKPPTSLNSGLQQNYFQRDSESTTDSRSNAKSAKNLGLNANYFESKFDHLNKIIKI